jgi:hypothetical protein
MYTRGKTHRASVPHAVVEQPALQHGEFYRDATGGQLARLGRALGAAVPPQPWLANMDAATSQEHYGCWCLIARRE